MNILLLSSTNNVKNGCGNITHELCSFLKGKIDFTLLLPKKEPRYSYTNYKVEYVLPDYIFDMKTPKVLDYIRFNYKPEKEVDIVHSLFEVPYAFLGARLAKKYHKPLIVGTQGTYAIKPLFMWPERYVLQYAYNSANLITAPSKFTRDHIVKFSGTTTPIKILHNGVNFERFQENVDIGHFQSRYKGKHILLTVGSIKDRKGQDIVIKALGILKRHRNDFHYICIGSGHFIDTYKALARDEGVGDDVSFLGEIQGQDLVRYFKLADIYVHTPRVSDWNFEGFGIVYLEASACAKPIIAADAGGIRDAVIDGKTGLVVPENDPSATAEAIGNLLDDPDLRNSFGSAGLLYAREHDWSFIAQKFLDMYTDLV